MNERNLAVKPEIYLKDKSQVPPHVTLEDYRKLREAVLTYWERKKKFTNNYQKIVSRDLLIIDYMWEIGGRIGDILNITFGDFEGRFLNLYNKKRKKNIIIDVSDELYGDTLKYIREQNIKDTEKIFDIKSPQRINQVLKEYGKEIGFPEIHKEWKNGRIVKSTLRPHLFRHGMAIHLLNQGVNIMVISARLGHANPQVTQSMYLKITGTVQREHVKNVKWR